jgi:hypothetical protein
MNKGTSQLEYGAQFVHMGMPTVCLKITSANHNKYVFNITHVLSTLGVMLHDIYIYC